jgi:hypothetical protein
MLVGCTVKMIRTQTKRYLVIGDFMQRSDPTWGLVISFVLAAGLAAGCFAYLISNPLAEMDRSKLPSHAPQLIIQDKEASAAINPPKNEEEKTVETFQRAADAILSRAANMSASAPVTSRPVGMKVPLPRRRPVSNP